MLEKKYTFCRICEALCGLEVHVEDGKVTEIKPNEQHQATQGFACVKGLKQHKMYSSPDRLQYPLKKVGDRHERISWAQAMQEIGEKVKKFRQVHPNSIAMYVGTAAGFGVLHPVFAQGFMTGIGSKSMFSSATQDCSNKFAVSHHMYGFPFTLTFPDIEHISCLIVVGANPLISKWSFLQVPNPSQKLKDIERRGGKIFFIDPRQTESSKVAGEHIFIRPGTDVFFFLSFLLEVIEQKGLDQAKIAQYYTGFEQIGELAQAWPAEKTAPITNIPPEVLKQLVKTYLDADGAALYCSTGVNMGGNGTLSFWIQECINAVSGNLDKRGGTLVGKGVIDFPKFASKKGILMRPDISRVGKFRSVNDAFPGGILAEEILQEGPEQIKALFVTGGNPLLTMANSEKLRRAMEKLELLVCLDIQPSETASMAHYILPCTSPLQRPDLPFIFPLMLGLQTKPYLQATQALLPPEGEQKDEASIYLALARACGTPIFGSSIAQRLLEAFRKKDKQNPENIGNVPQEGVLNFLLRITRQKSFKNLLKYPHGKMRQAHQAQSFLGKRVYTEDAKVHLAPQILMDEAHRRLEADFQKEWEQRHLYKLITRRAVKTHNSWTHNIEEFVSGEQRQNFLFLHPDDAQKLGLQEDDLADVRSETAQIRLPVKFLSTLMPGSVAVPHGWGHQASGLGVAKKTKGVNVNILAADGPEKIDPISGMVHLTGIPVEIVPAQGDLKSDNWSGLEDPYAFTESSKK